MIQQIIQGQTCCIRTRIIMHPNNDRFKKVLASPLPHPPPEKEYKSEEYHGECAEDDIKQNVNSS
jgi:hypothetical protein